MSRCSTEILFFAGRSTFRSENVHGKSASHHAVARAQQISGTWILPNHRREMELLGTVPGAFPTRTCRQVVLHRQNHEDATFRFAASSAWGTSIFWQHHSSHMRDPEARRVPPHQTMGGARAGRHQHRRKANEATRKDSKR